MLTRGVESETIQGVLPKAEVPATAAAAGTGVTLPVDQGGTEVLGTAPENCCHCGAKLYWHSVVGMWNCPNDGIRPENNPGNLAYKRRDRQVYGPPNGEEEEVHATGRNAAG